MNFSHTRRRDITNLLRIFILLGLLAGLLLIHSAPPERTRAQGTPNPAQESRQLSPDELRQRKDWHIAMAQLPLPASGCFQSAYPNRQWNPATCRPAPNIPMQPKHGPRPLVVGNGDDVSAQVPTATDFISTGIGTFDSVTNVTSESSPIGNTGPPVANAYTLQLNTNFFSSTACSGAADPTVCQGWEQFVFANDGTSAFAFIQYWLLRHNNPCPAGWNQFSFTGSGDIYCWRNSTNSVGVPNQPITNLGSLSLSGSVSATGDSISFSDGTSVFAATGDNSVNAAAGWNIAEFNVFGYGGNSDGGGGATFNDGASAIPRTRIFYGGTAPPLCTAVGFTGETNNLSFGPTAPAVAPPGPAVSFQESTAGGAASNCAAATSVGDTHLTTAAGLFYDFQSSGDYVLAQAEPSFVVHARQVSGAPTWPDASINTAVATRMGKSRVAVCLPGQLNVDGNNTEVSDGKSLSTPEGVDIWRQGNTYTIVDQNGNSVRAVLNGAWMDVTVGFGRWPTTVTGLLANAENDVNKIAARDGAVLTNPFNFQELYQRYGESWRVAPEESLLSVCGDRNVQRGNPGRPFFAGDLDRNVRERARAVCVAAGVKGDALLDACTLDVAVIGNDAAAKVFVNARTPVAVGNIVTTPGGGGGRRSALWLLLIIVVVVILLILLLRRRRTTP